MSRMDPASRALIQLLEKATPARLGLVDNQHETAFRLFNGFLEGFPGISIDIYATTIVIQWHGRDPSAGNSLVDAVLPFLQQQFPWLQAGLLKIHHDPTPENRKGIMLFGEILASKIRENGTWYALDLRLHQDAGFYLDTRNLRHWLTRSLGSRTLLNTFAYTGSLGVAALRGGASRVVQLDLDRAALDLARTSYVLNGLAVQEPDILCGDFWSLVKRFKLDEERFDCVVLDPPFFSSTSKARFDLNLDSARLINKVRPLVVDGGWIVSVNNAVFVSGRDYLSLLEKLCKDGYLQVDELIPVPEDFSGYPSTRVGSQVTDPAPFNHSTKITVLRVHHKPVK
jgi:23S rRNA (cytosine1962-C5)-methyltransferase